MMSVVGECFFWYRLTRVVPDKFHRAVKRLCVCVCMLTHYKDMKGNAKCRNCGGLVVRGHPRSPAMSSFDRMHMTFYSTLIETMHPSRNVFELQRVICQKSPISTHHISIWHPKFRVDHWHQKARVPGLSCGIACMTICLAVLVQYYCVLDITYGRTHDNG